MVNWRVMLQLNLILNLVIYCKYIMSNQVGAISDMSEHLVTRPPTRTRPQYPIWRPDVRSVYFDIIWRIINILY